MRKLVYGLAVGLVIGVGIKPVYSRLFPATNVSVIHLAKTAAFEVIPAPVDVVMLGDSHTHWGEWASLLPGRSVANLGIAGDTIERIQGRLGTVYRLKPKQVFVMMGTNNIQRASDMAALFANYEAVITDLQAHGTSPVIQATPLAGSEVSGSEAFNDRAADLNRRLEVLAKERGLPFVQFEAQPVDAYRIADGLHLNAAAYRRWATAVAPLITAPRN